MRTLEFTGRAARRTFACLRRAGGWNGAVKPHSRLTKTRRVRLARFASLGLGIACSVWDPAPTAAAQWSKIARINAKKKFEPLNHVERQPARRRYLQAIVAVRYILGQERSKHKYHVFSRRAHPIRQGRLTRSCKFRLRTHEGDCRYVRVRQLRCRDSRQMGDGQVLCHESHRGANSGA